MGFYPFYPPGLLHYVPQERSCSFAKSPCQSLTMMEMQVCCSTPLSEVSLMTPMYQENMLVFILSQAPSTWSQVLQQAACSML